MGQSLTVRLYRTKAADLKDPQPTLYIVATPIGTLADCSPRAREILSSAGFIACEDTRRTKELMLALDLQHGPLVSLHEHNERNKTTELVERLLHEKQKCAALVSDAGTPAISDPGALFVDACHSAGIRVESVPGPSSLPAAAAASGFLRPRMIFSGFLARNGKEQREEFDRWKHCSPCVAVCFESPNRVLQTLKNASETFPDNMNICVSREISKKFEEHIRGPLNEVIQKISNLETLRGECVICFDLAGGIQAENSQPKLTLEDVTVLALEHIASAPNARVKEVTRLLAEKHQLNAKELYNAVIGSRKS
jgi:16S rRNA (cytidine1402-2'-O)-methyltransferase